MDVQKLFSEKQLEKLLQRMQRPPPIGIATRDHKQNSRTYKSSFMGSVFVDWLVKDLRLSRSEAAALGKLMLEQNMLLALTPETKVLYDNDDSLYAFKEISAKSGSSAHISDKNLLVGKKSGTLRPGLVVGLESLSVKDIKDQVQRQLFGSEEVVRAVVRVKRAKRSFEKRNNASGAGEEWELLCLTVKTDMRMLIQRVRYLHGAYSIAATWTGEDVKAVNFAENSETGFIISFDKVYHFIADSTTERNEFVWRLLQLSQAYYKRTPQTTIEILELRLLLESDGVKDLDIGDSESSRFITEVEEKQIDELLGSRFSGDAHNIDRLTEELSKELVKLETENINDLIRSHQDIKKIWSGIAGAQEELMAASMQFEDYQKILDSISTSFEQIEQKNNRMAIITKNQNALLVELESLLSKIQLDRSVIQILENGTFEVGMGLEETINAAYNLDALLKSDLGGGLDEMKAVAQQLELFLKLRGTFAKRFRVFINEKFEALAETRLNEKRRGLVLSDHSDLQKVLLAYKPLIHWLKIMDEDIRTNPKLQPLPQAADAPVDPIDTRSVTDDYSLHMSEVYRKELKHFFAVLRRLTLREKIEKLTFKTAWAKALASLPWSKDSPRISGGSIRSQRSGGDLTETDFDDETTLTDDDVDMEDDDDTKSTVTAGGTRVKVIRERMNIVKSFNVALTMFLPVVLSEQQFCIDFFKFDNSPTRTTADLDKLLDKLYEGHMDYVNKIIYRAYKTSPFYCISLWGELHKFEENYKSLSNWITNFIKACKTQCENLFGAYINAQCTYIKETKLSSIKGVGILEHCKKYPEFVDRMEVSGAVNAKPMAELAYDKLTTTLFDWVMSLTEDDYAQHVVRFENFHFLFTELSHRNVPYLRKYAEKAKKVHDTSLEAYVHLLVFKRFTKLMEFFDGVDKLLRTVPPENIQYQGSHSNHQLAKLLLQYDASTLEKGLYKEYTRIQRDLSLEEGLIPRVWSIFKEYLTSKYKHFENLMAQCYRQHRLPVTSDALLHMYTSVEQMYAQKASKKEKSK